METLARYLLERRGIKEMGRGECHGVKAVDIDIC